MFKLFCNHDFEIIESLEYSIIKTVEDVEPYLTWRQGKLDTYESKRKDVIMKCRKCGELKKMRLGI
jgi:hypothetical protein